jgi:glycosyltransferase involved in cell wall biosynthesis/SAM-dependent methyltransferase
MPSGDRLAWFTPLPPVKAGVVRRHVDVLPLLALAYEIDVFVDDPAATRTWPGTSIRVHSAHDLVWKHLQHRYDLVVYQLGNARGHDYMWPYLVRYPGLVVLRDGQLHHARARALLQQKRRDDYRCEFHFNHPEADRDLPELGITGMLGSLAAFWPMRRVIVESARLVAVHDAWLADALREDHPDARIEVVEMGVPESVAPTDRGDSVRTRHGIPAGAVLFTAFGEVTTARRIPHVIRALESVAGAVPDVHLLLAGETVDEYDARADARAAGVSDRVTIAGGVADDEVDAYLAATDVCVCLTWPSREISASWLRCLAAGRPTIITDLAHQAEVPSLDPRTWAPASAPLETAAGHAEPVCVSIDILDEEHSLKLAIRRLATDARLRATLGRRAHELWRRRFTIDRMASGYRDVIAMASAAEPPHAARARLPKHLLADRTDYPRRVLRAVGLPESHLARLFTAGSEGTMTSAGSARATAEDVVSPDMFTRTANDSDDLRRLMREREEADRLYNDALTALDAAIQRCREMPHPPPAYDEHAIRALHEQWALVSEVPAGGGWRGRVRRLVWRAVEPLFARQQAFNASVLDHVTRSGQVQRATATAVADTLSVLREELGRLVSFESRLVQYAQQITPYVDTKDREVAGSIVGLARGLTEAFQKRWESMAARERRYDAQVDDVRGTLSVIQRATQTIKREVERLSGSQPGAQQPPAATPPLLATPPDGLRPAPALDSYKYVGFEDRFRGSQGEIRDRIAAYVADFAGARDVLDIGCGRGEFLDLLREQGIPARGVDLNDEMAALCRARGLDATAGDALSYLAALPDGSLGGLIATQVVEHMEPDYLIRLLDVAYHKLRPGARIVLETINPACWYAFFASYIRDITHVRPLHPDTLHYLLVASGFQRVAIRYSVPFPEESKLQAVGGREGPSTRDTAGDHEGAAPSGAVADLTTAFNENVAKLNDLMFTYLDYAAIGERL